MRIASLIHEAALLWALAMAPALGACGEISEDEALFSELDRLRVLAVRSEPADLLVGEVATLSAFTFEPEQRELEYAWSWCPSRREIADGGACRIEEADLQRAWGTLDTGRELPPYDLGANREAELTHVFGADVLSPLCAALSAGEDDAEQALLSCLLGLELSVSLSVRSAEEEVTAVKRLVLLAEDVDATERNQNPAPTGELLVSDVLDGRLIEEGDALVPGRQYALSLVLDESVSEPFLPSAPPGAGMGERRRETLAMSWFATDGSFPTADAFGDGDGPLGIGGGGERTTFVDGQNEFGALLENHWRLPRTLDSSEATLVLVLRDERGGVGWAEHRFALGLSE
jgi:hypothetical protein